MKFFANSNLGFAFQPKDRIQFLSIHNKKKSILQVLVFDFMLAQKLKFALLVILRIIVVNTCISYSVNFLNFSQIGNSIMIGC